MRKVMLSMALVILLAGGVYAQSDRGHQFTPDGNRALVSKDVGTERWSISLDLFDATVSGVVYELGQDPVFIWCDPTDVDDDDVEYNCFAADECDDGDCDEWDFINSVQIPFSFFGL